MYGAAAIDFPQRVVCLTSETAEIAYLLGFDEPNSFHRAYRSWTGTTPARRRHAALLACGAAPAGRRNADGEGSV